MSPTTVVNRFYFYRYLPCWRKKGLQFLIWQRKIHLPRVIYTRQFIFNPTVLSLERHSDNATFSYALCRNQRATPTRTHSISGLNSRVLKLIFLALKLMVKSGLEFILKFTEPLQRYLLACQSNSALMGRWVGTGQQQLWRGSISK